MRVLMLVLSLLLCTQGAYAAQTEPFGAPLRAMPDYWFMSMRERILEEKKEVILSLANAVREKPPETRLSWTIQLVTLLGLGPDNCAPAAILKLEVLRTLGFAAEDLRFVVGTHVLYDVRHSVAAVRVDGTWLILDNGYMVRNYHTVADTEIRRSFHAMFTYQ